MFSWTKKIPKGLGNDVKPAFTTNAITLNFLSSISPGLAVIFIRLPSYGVCIFSWSDLPGVVLAFWIFILNIFKSLQNYRHRVTDITSFEKKMKSSLCHTLGFIQIWWNIIRRICFWRNFSSGLLWWSSLQTKEGAKIVKRFWRRKYREDDMSCAWPFYSLVKIFPNALHSD